jgi:hypothetical protein
MNRKRRFSIALLVIALATAIASAETNTVDSIALASTNISITPTNLAQLLALPPEQLDKVDNGGRLHACRASNFRSVQNSAGYDTGTTPAND